MARQLTLMAVHAHPDDESSSTGGVLARYAKEGVRTVVVTCTNGEFGDAPGGVKPGEDGHDPAAVAEIRLGELERACATLGVHHLETLGYHDSGMQDWDYKDRHDVFASVELDEAVGRLAGIFERHRPDVVVTYDHADGYTHPDHLRASEITVAATSATGIPKKAYFIGRRSSRWVDMRKAMEDAGIELPEWPEPDEEWQRRMREAEARITTEVDVRDHIDSKREALMLHASQISESFFSKIPAEAYAHVFGEECFVRVHDTTGAPLPETDLLAGLR